MAAPKPLQGQKILVTGPTSQVALPVALGLATANDVWGIARFSDQAARERLEVAGVTCVARDLATADFTDVPDDFDYVLNFAVAKGGDDDWDRDLAANAEAVGLLMARLRRAKAFLHCSSTAVYQHQGPEHPLRETDPLGDNHRAFGFMPTYSITKIAAEAMARFGARAFEVPTTIARLSVPYGDDFGWPRFQLAMMQAGHAVPVHADAPSEYNPIHIDDIVAQIPALLDAATIPATIVNWAGDDVVSIEQWCELLAKKCGLSASFQPTEQTIASVACDTTKRASITGPCTVHWTEGIARMASTVSA